MNLLAILLAALVYFTIATLALAIGIIALTVAALVWTAAIVAYAIRRYKERDNR